jgi:hypothetical protein
MNPRPPTQRERWLNDAYLAGLTGDARLWARTLAEARINRVTLNEAYARGARARATQS